MIQKINWATMARATRTGQAPRESLAKARACWPTLAVSSKAVVASSQR